MQPKKGTELYKKKQALNNQRIRKKYEQLGIMLYRGEKEKILSHVAKTGETISGYVNRLISEDIQNFIPIDSSKMYKKKRSEDGGER